MKAKIVVLAGDGIGPEVTDEARKVLRAVAQKFNHQFDFSDQLMGGRAIDELEIYGAVPEPAGAGLLALGAALLLRRRRA